MGELVYGITYNNLCERLYARCELALNVLQVAAGSSVLVSAAVLFLGDGRGGISPVWSAVGGSILTVLTAIAMFWQPAVRVERHKACAGLFVELQGRAWDLRTKQVAAEVASIRKSAPLGPRGLEMPAWNQAVASMGHPRAPLGRWERVLDWLA